MNKHTASPEFSCDMASIESAEDLAERRIVLARGLSPLDSLQRRLSRRDALQFGALTAGGFLLLSQWSGSRAKAQPLPLLVWLAETSFAGVVGWFVGKLLDDVALGEKIRQDAKEVRVALPKPSGDVFHDSHAERTEIHNVQLPSTRSPRYGHHVAVNRYLRSHNEARIPDFKDINRAEIRRIVHEELLHGTLLYPCGPRTPPDADDHIRFAVTCKLYKTDPSKLRLEYCRPVNNGEIAMASFGVTSRVNPGSRDLLIAV